MVLRPEVELSEQRRKAYRDQGYWGDATLLDYWNMAVAGQPDKDAVVEGSGRRLSYARMDECATRLARWMARSGICPGDVVCIQLPGCLEFTTIYIAALKAGAVVVPLIPAFRGRELTHVLQKCGAKALFMPLHFRNFSYEEIGWRMHKHFGATPVYVATDATAPQDAASLLFNSIMSDPANDSGPCRAQGPEVRADDIAAVLFTSGTENLPKGALLTHNNIISSIRSFAAVLNLNSRDVMLMPSPVGHATGFHHGVTTPFILGGTSVLLDIFCGQKALELIAREHCTYGMGSAPFVYDMSCALSKKDYDISSLRFFICGGAPSPRRLLDQMWERGFHVVNCYGSTESVPHTIAGPHEPRSILHQTEGRPVPGCEIRVVDDNHATLPAGEKGEEASRGPNVFMGYLGEPELTRKVLDDEGWYYSGDIGVMDDGGNLRIIGRKKDMIVRGGENISCGELEEIIREHPSVADAAVVGMPDPRLGERACAYVTLRPNAPALTFEALVSFFEDHCTAKFKYPERLEIIESMPRNPAGKIVKKTLREDILAKLACTPCCVCQEKDHAQLRV